MRAEFKQNQKCDPTWDGQISETPELTTSIQSVSLSLCRTVLAPKMMTRGMSVSLGQNAFLPQYIEYKFAIDTVE